MMKIECPNCKNFYTWVESDDKECPFKIQHFSPTCPKYLGVVVYAKTRSEAVRLLLEFLREKFPFFTIRKVRIDGKYVEVDDEN